MTKEKFRWLVLGLLVVLVVSGCGPDEAELEETVVAQVEAGVEGTVEARPTMTAQPTYTAEPTHTAQPTHTAEPTQTTAPTYTPAATYTTQPTYTPEPTNTAVPTDTPTPAPTLPPQPTAPPTAQFTALGVEVTKSYMDWFPGAYYHCTIFGPSGCLNPNRSVDCVAFVNNYNTIAARKDLAPTSAEEPVLTAANIYRASVYEFLDLVSPHVTYCQEQMGLGRTEIASQELGEYGQIIVRERELIGQMDQVLNILRNVEAGDAS